MKKKLIIITCIVVVAIAVFILKTIKDAGEFKTLTPHSGYSCVKVQNVPGPEDIAIDNSTGTAFVSSFNRREFMKGRLIQGAIFSYNLEGKPVLKNLTSALKFDFYPHGISFFAAPDGKKYLFAINHRKEKNCVEIFEFKNSALIHTETVTGDLMISPNDIAAVGPRQFYFTNDHGSKSEFSRTIEDYLQLPRSNVVFFDGKQLRVAAGGFRLANGIWAAKDGKRLYVATTTGRKFYEYLRSDDGSLTRVSESDMDSGCDNIDVDAGGTIRLASHPKLLTFVKHAENESNISPSQILEIFKDGKSGYTCREAYLDSGKEISAASVASAYKNRILMGAVFENFFLDCTMK